jgi:hypothetical protein
MSSSSSIVIHEVVDQLLLAGTLYDDLVRTLTTKCERRTHAEGWTSSELLIEIPELRLFFQSNRAFPPSYVLASCPGIHCVTRGAVVLYTTTTAAAGQQEDQAPAVVVDSYSNTNKNTGRQGEDEQQMIDELPNAISASSTMDSLSTVPVGSDSHEQRGLLTFEDELVKIIQAAPDQRIKQSHLRRDCKNEWTAGRPKKFEALVRTLRKVRIVKINGSKFVVLSSFDPRVDAPPVDQEALERLEDELVELVRSSDNHRIRASRGIIDEAYQQKYKKPLKLEPTGFFTIKNALQAMPRLARSKECRRMLIEAPSMPRRCDDAPIPPPPLTRSRAAQQSSGRSSPTVSAALPPTLADPYSRSSDLPPPELPPGLPPGISSTGFGY